MFRRKEPEPQPSFWIATSELPSTPVHGFYDRVNRALDEAGFSEAVRGLCRPFYEADASRGGRPGTDPAVYFKMLMVGFFENLASERAIAARCADSLSIRAFLHYSLTEATPDHSTLSVIRLRLSAEVYEGVFALLLRALKKKGLLKGKNLGIDASVLEANASLRGLQSRLTGEAYAAYVKRLAEAAGVDVRDAGAVRRFDKKRPGRKTSNDEWHNPHDPDAKIGRTKRGATRMIYKPEHVMDLDTGAIVEADVRPGDEHDTAELAERLLAAEQRLKQTLEEPPTAETVETVTADKGYYKVDELTTLHEVGIGTVISDPIANRKLEKLDELARGAVEAARQAVGSEAGKALLRRRGELLERGFEHVLDCGGARRTTLRRLVNIRKRYLIQAACANLSLLMRHLIRVGTPKQALATAGTQGKLLLWLLHGLSRAPAVLRVAVRIPQLPSLSRVVRSLGHQAA